MTLPDFIKYALPPIFVIGLAGYYFGNKNCEKSNNPTTPPVPTTITIDTLPVDGYQYTDEGFYFRFKLIDTTGASVDGYAAYYTNAQYQPLPSPITITNEGQTETFENGMGEVGIVRLNKDDPVPNNDYTYFVNMPKENNFFPHYKVKISRQNDGEGTSDVKDPRP